MIPVMRKTDLVEAKYTKLLKDVNDDILTNISTLFQSFDTDNPNDLYKHFIAKYRYSEICISDESIFLQCVTDTFNELFDYYSQVLAAYKKDINIDNITKRISTRTDASSGTNDDRSSASNTSTHREYDLPNKQINVESEDGYLSNKDTDNNEGIATSHKEHESEYSSDNTTTDNKDFIRLKREYLAHIRDIYEDFCNDFEDCFLHIY